MIDNQIFSIFLLGLIFWLLADDVLKGLKESGIELFGKKQPARAKVLVEDRDPIYYYLKERAKERENESATSAGKALGMR